MTDFCGVIFVGLKEAFDLVVRQILLRKLQIYQLSNKAESIAGRYDLYTCLFERIC